ncbi:MAG: protein translocase subunit SecD [Oscillospiraceae bacterium]|jgi:SecD/SecF fusion protein|nr:protein translocase subunit SecD [Oscillospiraceae bacterium]
MRKSLTSIGAIILIILILLFTAFYGFELGPLKIPKVEKGVKLGLDLVGGSEITYEAVLPEGISQEETDSGIETAITMLRQRLNTLGYTEANVYRYGAARIVLEVPNEQDPEAAVQKLGTTAIVEFRDYEGNVVLDGKDIESADAIFTDNQSGSKSWIIQMKLTKEGVEKFREGTKIAAQQSDGNNYVAIMLDEEQISAPSVSSEYASTGIDTDSPIIELGSGSDSEAKWLAEIIKAGSLPFALKESKLQAIGAQLGEKSLDNALIAGIIGLILVMVYMLIVYRLPGAIACFSLLVYILLFVITVSAFGINLTLPGIAGVILTIGMAVDANVIIYERLREEIATGRPIKTAIEAGFKRAFSAIFDSNLTTIIAAAVLLWQGTGTILGFAKTLFAGVVLSMICMLIIPRLLLRACANLGLTKPALYASKVKERDASKGYFPFSANFKKYIWIISSALSALAIVGLLLLPFGVRLFNLDHDFVGGVMMDFEIGQTVTREITDDVSGIVRDVSGESASSVTQSGDGGTVVSIKMSEIPSETRDAVFKAIAEKYGTDKVSIVSSEFVSASAGRDITRSAFLAASLAAVLILVYIAFRFELRSGVAAIIALLHDVLIVLSFYIILQIPMNMDFIAAVLTIIGYSINATIVIFDRIRENWKRQGGSGDFAECVDKSVIQTFRRSIGTTITTLLPLIMVIVLGVSSVRNFGIPIAIGLLGGLYSSMCVSGPLWNLLKGKSKVKVR